MLCKKPFLRGNIPFGCGQCLPCRVNRRRQWMWRQFFESLSHNDNCFLTLTYRDEDLPRSCSLDPSHLQLWLKRFRLSVLPLRIRYFAVGEYGEESQRPHYHLSLFGVSPDTVAALASSRNQWDSRRIVLPSWPYGEVFAAEFNELTAQYIAGYVVKKLTNAEDPHVQKILQGRHPEFARMSRRPGIGRHAMSVVASTLSSSGYVDLSEDAPAFLQIGKRKIPLGRYLLRALREALGFTPEYIETLKQRGAYKSSLEMSALLEAALTDAPLSSSKTAYLASVQQKIRQVETRATIWKKKGRV